MWCHPQSCSSAGEPSAILKVSDQYGQFQRTALKASTHSEINILIPLWFVLHLCTNPTMPLITSYCVLLISCFVHVRLPSVAAHSIAWLVLETYRRQNYWFSDCLIGYYWGTLVLMNGAIDNAWLEVPCIQSDISLILVDKEDVDATCMPFYCPKRYVEVGPLPMTFPPELAPLLATESLPYVSTSTSYWSFSSIMYVSFMLAIHCNCHMKWESSLPWHFQHFIICIFR